MLTAELRVFQRHREAFVRLFERKGVQERLFAQCHISLENSRPLEAFVESVTDSSRYFVLRCEDEKSGRKASIGIGFQEREESFSFKAALQDFVNSVGRERELERRAAAFEATRPAGGAGDEAPDLLSIPNLDLQIKDNQKITVNLMGRASTAPASGPRKAKQSGTGGFAGLAPPPPPGSKFGGGARNAAEQLARAGAPLAAPPGAQGAAPPSGAELLDLAGSAPAPAPGGASADDDDDWGDFEGAS